MRGAVEGRSSPWAKRISGYWPINREERGRALWLTWQTAWLFAAQLIASLFNYLSNAAAGRFLGPVDYGAFAALSAILLILVSLSGAVQTLTAQGVARLAASGRRGEAAALLRHLLVRWALRWGGVAALLGLFLSPWLASRLHTSAGAAATMSLALLPLAMLPVVQGALRGGQRFTALGATNLLTGASRFVLTALLIYAGLGLVGAVAALPLSFLAATLLGLWLLRQALRGEAGNATLPAPWGGELARAGLGLLAFAFLVNADVILVKNRFPGAEAGLYSAMAVLGKAVLYFPAAVPGVLLPLVVTRTVRGQRSLPLLLVSLGAVLALCASLALPLSLFPRALLRLLFGAIYVEHASLLGWYAVAMTLYAVANVWLIYSIGKGHTGFAFGLLVIALAEAVALLTLSLRLQEVVMVILAGGIAAVVWACAEGLMTLRNRREERAP